MAFDFNSLKAAWRNDSVLGKWNGVSVYACPKNQLRNVSQQYFYIVFDDNNALVRDEYRYGTVSPSGNVTELNRPSKYKYPGLEPEPEPKPEEVNVSVQEIPLVDAGTDDFFARLESEINSLLHSDFSFEGLEI